MANSSALPSTGASSQQLSNSSSSSSSSLPHWPDITSTQSVSCHVVNQDAAMSTVKPSMTVVASLATATILLVSSGIFLWRRRVVRCGKNRASGADADADGDSPAAPKKRITLEDVLNEGNGQLAVKPIGRARSLYRLCVGTPRQGLLAPHARGLLELTELPMDAVRGLEDYSHVWVVFVFHLNTMGRRVPNKIAPPALGGRKVGTLATRSPHRFNPIGITLCRLDSIRASSSSSSSPILDVSGLDLVDGTPILDVKPYVPHYDSVPTAAVPLWVAEGLGTRRPVRLESQALQQLEAILRSNPTALEFYGLPKNRTSATTTSSSSSVETTLDTLAQCIAEVLSVDVRSKWQTNKARKGMFQAERAQRMQAKLGDAAAAAAGPTVGSIDGNVPQKACTQQLDNLLIHYHVQAAKEHARSTSEGSGAEDTVYVDSIQLLDVGKRHVSTERGEEERVVEDFAVDRGDSSAAEGGVANEPSPVGEAPADGDYSTLKNYWNQAASKNTPTGLVPVDTPTGMPPIESRVSGKFFSPDTPTRPGVLRTQSFDNDRSEQE